MLFLHRCTTDLERNACVVDQQVETTVLLKEEHLQRLNAALVEKIKLVEEHSAASLAQFLNRILSPVLTAGCEQSINIKA